MTAISTIATTMDLPHIYNVSIHKLHDFQTARRDSTDGLRKLVLINSFINNKFVAPEEYDEPLEWSDEDIKKDEQSWLDAMLDDLDQEEDEDGYVYISKTEDTSSSSTQPTTPAETATVATVINDVTAQPSTHNQPTDPFSSIAHPRSLFSPFLSSLLAEYHDDVSPRTNFSRGRKHAAATPPTSPASLSTTSEYRSFLDSGLRNMIPKLNIRSLAIGAPRFYQKFCLDRDYLAGISVDAVDGPTTSDAILDFIIAETRRYDAVKRSKDDLDIIRKEKWITQRLISEIESGRIWSIDGYDESGQEQKMACF